MENTLIKEVKPEPMVTLYKATNLVNGKFYIGITTKSLRHRIGKHLVTAKKPKYIFHKAINKYTPNNFKWEVMWYCNNLRDALAEEIRIINILKPEYNLTSGGEGIFGYKFPRHIVDIITEKRRKALTGRKKSPHSIESRKKMSESHRKNPPKWWIGRKHTQKAIENMRLAHTGWSGAMTEKRKASIIINRGKATEKTKKRIICLWDGRIFPSSFEADRFYGLRRGGAAYTASGYAKSTRGLSFKYMDAP